MSGPDDRLLQRLAAALSVPAEEPEESELGRLRAAVARVRRLGLLGPVSSGGGDGTTARRPGHASPGPLAERPDLSPLAPIVFHPPPEQWPFLESP